MKKLFLILFIFPITFTSAQAPTLFFDLDSVKISERKFWKLIKNKSEELPYQRLFYKNDSTRIFKLILDKDSGILTKNEHLSLISSINKTRTKPDAEFTIIQYHPGRDRCNGGSFRGNRYHYKYLQLLKQKMDFNHYWIHKKDSTLVFDKPQNIDWQQDENRFVEKLFFRYPYACYSFVIINNKTRKYKSHYGEYADYTVTKIAEEMLNNK